MGRDDGEEGGEAAEGTAAGAGAGAGAGVGGGGHQGFLDRSKVRILLCDSDPRSSQDVLRLLRNCSYQVTCVKSARQVISVLNAQGHEIDIILAEVDLPIDKGFKMLKCIARNKDLRHIPIITMSAQDEVSVVVKCLRLGAADYLVKPLRTNELLNLWTHVWRRRRMVTAFFYMHACIMHVSIFRCFVLSIFQCFFQLGLPDKNFFAHDFDSLLSDPSDANTNSTTLLSDDTDDKPKGITNQETGTSNHREYESNPSVMGPEQNHTVLKELPGTMEDGDLALSWGGMFSRPIKTDLKVAESSAFLAYVKSSALTTSSFSSQLERSSDQMDPWDHHQNSFSGTPDGNEIVARVNAQDREAFQMPMEFPMVCYSSSSLQPERSNERPDDDASGAPPVFHFPFYHPGMVEQGMLLSSVQNFQDNSSNTQAHGASAMLPQYNVYSQCHSMPMMPSFPYNSPVGINLQSSHVAAPNLWSSMTSAPMPDEKCSRSERRAAALVKFRQKRKERCFDKKVRYINRKRLAETRPRVRGQFARQTSNVDVISVGDDNSEGDEDGEPTSRELEMVSSPEL